MTNALDDFPHTGAMRYIDSIPKIPCVAISTIGANLLSKILKTNKETKFFMQTHCEMKDSVLSYNVIGELRGTENQKSMLLSADILIHGTTAKERMMMVPGLFSQSKS